MQEAWTHTIEVSSSQQAKKEGNASHMGCQQEMSNIALMAIGDESFDELDEVSDPTYDELYDAFKELHDDWKKII